MSTKITGYGIFKSSGGNTCIQCKIRMRKGLPYMSPVKGKKNPRELKGKSICATCMSEIINNMEAKIKECGTGEIEKYERRRFMEHFN